MTHITHCPSCERKLRVPEVMLDTKVKCPSCEVVFVARTSASMPEEKHEQDYSSATPSPSDAMQHEPAGAQGREQESPKVNEDLLSSSPHYSADDTRPCPVCGESIPATAERCRRCGEQIGEGRRQERPWEHPYYGVRRDSAPHRGGLILTLGILSIVLGFTWILSIPGLILGLCAWFMGQGDLRKMEAGNMDPQGRGTTQAGWICGIVGTCLSGLYSLCCVGYCGLIFFAILSESQSKSNPQFKKAPPPRISLPSPSEVVPQRLSDYLPMRRKEGSGKSL